ncbi:hypothetical protein Q5752_003383 [Cryptotrichosporon argae]
MTSLTALSLPSPRPDIKRTPSRAGQATPAEASGYLLLTIQHAVVQQTYDEQSMVLARGEMQLECVSLPIPPEIGRQSANPFAPSPSDPPVPTHDFWLVLRVATFELALSPTVPIAAAASAAGVSYTTTSPGVINAAVSVTLPRPSSAAVLEDLESFEVLLRQYGCLPASASALDGLELPVPSPATVPTSATAPAPAFSDDMRGRLVLVDEADGRVVGELESGLDVAADDAVARQDTDRPVVLDFGQLVHDYAGRQVKVETVPEDELDDWMLRGAHNISQGILSFGSWSTRGILRSADKFVKTTTPAAEPLKIGPTTKAGIRGVHNATVRTVSVTKSTVGLINNTVAAVVEKSYKKGIEPTIEVLRESSTPPRRSSTSATSTPPVLPPRPGSAGSAQAQGKAQAKPPLPLNKPAPSTGASTAMHTPVPAPGAHARIAVPTKTDALLAQERHLTDSPPPYEPPASASPASAPASVPAQQKKRGFLGRALLAAEVVWTSIDATANDLITAGTTAASQAAGHKYGADAGHATALLGGSVRNVALVYVDVKGVGRRGLLKATAKGFVKTRLRDGQEVTLQAPGKDGARQAGTGLEVVEGEVEVERGQGPGGVDEIVVGVAQLGRANAD